MNYTVPWESNLLQETVDSEDWIALDDFSYQMDWGQCNQVGPTLSSSVLL